VHDKAGKNNRSRGALSGEVFPEPKYMYSRQDAKNAKGVGRMTEDEIGKRVIDVETTIDFLALLASWRENLSSSPTNSAEDPYILQRRNTGHAGT
jgi:AAA+ ATPase superfamily predicted ATPase